MSLPSPSSFRFHLCLFVRLSVGATTQKLSSRFAPNPVEGRILGQKRARNTLKWAGNSDHFPQGSETQAPWTVGQETSRKTSTVRQWSDVEDESRVVCRPGRNRPTHNTQPEQRLPTFRTGVWRRLLVLLALATMRKPAGRAAFPTTLLISK